MTFNDSKRNTYAGVLGSKAVGEQAMMMGVSVIFALRRAIDSVRRDLGQSPLPFYTLGNVWKSVKKGFNGNHSAYEIIHSRAKIIFLQYIFAILRS